MVSSKKLTDCQTQCGQTKHAMVQDADVRWNGTYLMMRRLLEQIIAVDFLKFYYEAILKLSFNETLISLIILLVHFVKVQIAAQKLR